MNGYLIVNKPLHYTSMDVIRVLRKLIRMQGYEGKFKIGHAGTLDPLATGVLIVCIGKATKKIAEFMSADKEYVAEVDLSARTESHDAESEIQKVDAQPPSEEMVLKCLRSFIGTIDQVPPQHSAVKVDGQPAYKRARRGEYIELKSKTVTIHDIECVEYAWPVLKIRIHCGKGVYIRSLARDIGEALKTGGYLTSLERTRIGECDLQEALNPEEVKKNPSLISRYIIKV